MIKLQQPATLIHIAACEWRLGEQVVELGAATVELAIPAARAKCRRHDGRDGNERQSHQN